MAIQSVLLAVGLQQGHQAQKQQKQAAKEQRSIGRLEARKNRIQRMREANIARGEAENRAFTSGGQGSALAGAQSSIGTQLGASLGFSQSVQQHQENIFTANMKASGHQFNQQIANTGANLFATFNNRVPGDTNRDGNFGGAPIIDKSTIFS